MNAALSYNEGGAYGCVVTSATITGLGVFDNNLTLTSTGDDNVKTFTMPSGNVTISAEFEETTAISEVKADGARSR